MFKHSNYKWSKPQLPQFCIYSFVKYCDKKTDVTLGKWDGSYNGFVLGSRGKRLPGHYAKYQCSTLWDIPWIGLIGKGWVVKPRKGLSC